MPVLSLSLLLSAAHAEPPLPMDPKSLPAFPEGITTKKVHEVCTVEMVSEADGRHRVIGVTGCKEPFELAVRDRTSWWTWRTPPSDTSGAFDPTWALLTGLAGAPEGLYTRFEIAFDRPRLDAPAVVSWTGLELVAPRRLPKFTLPPEVQAKVPPEGCALLLHVDEEGRPERVQTQDCPEPVRQAWEIPLMTSSWERLEVDEEPHSFAVTFRVSP